jgi:hypothetical protein
VHVRYGRPVDYREDEEPRSYGTRIATAVSTLLDEDRTDWYTASRRAASGETPAPTGPDVAPWRRVWEASASPTSRRPKARAWR